MLRKTLPCFLVLLLLLLALSGCALAETAPAADTTAEFNGMSFPLDAEYISLGDTVVQDFDAFEAFLDRFTGLKQVDMWETKMPAAMCDRLAARYPGMKWGWTMVLQGKDHQHLIRTDYTSWSTLHNNTTSHHNSEDFSILRYCWNLMALDVGHNSVTDLEFLRDLPNLRVLIVACNQVTDISPLADLKNLEYAELFKNKIKDLSPLSGLDHLLDLNICFNFVEDYDPLQNLKSLKRLWIYSSRVPNQSPPDNIVRFLKESLPDTQVDSTHYSTAGTWRFLYGNTRHPHYDAIVRMFGEDHLHPHYEYIPFEDSFPLTEEAPAAAPEASAEEPAETPVSEPEATPAPADEPTPVPAEPRTDYLLPIDFTPGKDPSPEGYTENGYSDSTIQVTVDSGLFEDCVYWVADIHIKDASQLRTMSATDNGSFERNAQRRPEALAERSKAVVALNGDYYDSTERKSRGFILRQGTLFRNNLDEPGPWDARFMDVLLIDSNGDFHIVYQHVKDAVITVPDNGTILNSFSFGPALVDNGELIEDFQGADRWINMAADEYRQRICICQAGPLHYKVICCAGPYKGNTGMTIAQFARLVKTQDVLVAYNLDGGDSTWLYFKGAKVNDLGSTGRKLMDIIYFASAE